MSVEALATAEPDTSLRGRLDALLRPEFRVDVLVPAADDPILGTPGCDEHAKQKDSRTESVRGERRLARNRENVKPSI